MKVLNTLLALMAFTLTGPALAAAPLIGQPAPAIETTDASGNPFNLADHTGKIVVLEWTNHQCPFVVKHYSEGHMQALQTSARADGIEWVSIISSAPGKQGHVSGEKALEVAKDKGADPTTILIDETGEIGKAYDAQTTPHLYIIDADGTLVYKGAIDDNPSPRSSAIEGAKNYVSAALGNLKSGEPVEITSTPPYGCSVKY